MNEDSDAKMKITLKGKNIEPEAVKVARAMDLARKDMLASSSMNALNEQSKRWNELMTHLSGSSAASEMLNAELTKAGRVAEIVMGHSNAERKFLQQTSAMRDTIKRFSEMYRSPLQGELDKVLAIARQSIETGTKAVTLYQMQFDEVRRVAESIHTPWLNNLNAIASIQGLAGLSSIGNTLREGSHPFGKTATHLLRDQLGDWRHAQSWAVIDDPIQRSDFYLHQGLNSSLTDYPSDAFDEALNVTGIQPIEIKPVISSYQLNSEVESDIDEPPTHMVSAYKIIYTFESKIRKFIDKIMTERYGSNWATHRVPGDMKKNWDEKRTKALDYGESEHPLICYADFTHYETIIVRRDNWEEVFKAVFRNKASVTESLRRLYPMRIPTMHTRIIISDDILYLMAETQRILKAIENYG